MRFVGSPTQIGIGRQTLQRLGKDEGKSEKPLLRLVALLRSLFLKATTHPVCFHFSVTPWPLLFLFLSYAPPSLLLLFFFSLPSSCSVFGRGAGLRCGQICVGQALCPGGKYHPHPRQTATPQTSQTFSCRHNSACFLAAKRVLSAPKWSV